MMDRRMRKQYRRVPLNEKRPPCASSLSYFISFASGRSRSQRQNFVRMRLTPDDDRCFIRMNTSTLRHKAVREL